MQGDATYFSRRANEESAAAAQADHPEARKAHLELAKRYEELAHSITRHEGLIGVDPAGLN